MIRLQSKMKKKSQHVSNDQIRVLTEHTVEKADLLFEHLGFDYNQFTSRYIKGCCPIHGGDNPGAFTLYRDGDFSVGNWRCRTHGCHLYFKGNFLGFVKAALSVTNHGWSKKGDKTADFKEAINFLLRFNNTDLKNIKAEKNNSNGAFTKIIRRPPEHKKIERARWLKYTRIPCPYHIKRGYSEEVLTKYDVGLCENPKQSMYMRSVVPVYDEGRENVVGYTGRSIFDQCFLCMGYHKFGAKCDQLASKWRHSFKFPRDYYLYNYWFAKEPISKSGVVILVESPGDTWRCIEAGIENVCGLLGCSLGDGQLEQINKSGATTIRVALNNDEAGDEGFEHILNKCKNLYNVERVKMNKNDIGSMSIKETKELLCIK